VIRLAGLPAVARYPSATVTRHEDRIEIVFAGATEERRIDVPLRLLGSDDDAEAEELRLLAQLEGLGYDVDRQVPLGDEE
jgi:hypothetical protein